MGNAKSKFAVSSQHDRFSELAAYDIDKKTISFACFSGKVVLVVNVASKCALTPLNYKELAELGELYKDQPFAIIAFPCNQFFFQEPGTNEEIKEFARKQDFKGLLMDKVPVNGKGASEVYKFLKVGSKNLKDITWNFEKFLVGKDGLVYGRYAPKVSPKMLVPYLDELLKQ